MRLLQWGKKGYWKESQNSTKGGSTQSNAAGSHSSEWDGAWPVLGKQTVPDFKMT